MRDRAPATHIVPILWFVAAGLSFLAVGIRLSTAREMSWPVAAGALFCLLVGLGTRASGRRLPPE